MDPKYILILLSMDLAFGLQYPLYSSRYYPLTSSRRQSSYRAMPATSRRVEYPVSDYEDVYLPSDPIDFDYYSKYDPISPPKYGSPSLIPFYQPRDYYIEKIPRTTWDRLTYYDEPVPQEPISDDMDAIYDDASWYDDTANADANRAFLRNLLLAQLYQDSKYPSTAGRYELKAEDNNGRKYVYGIPVTSMEEAEKARKYFEDNDNDDVKALEALARKEGKAKEMEMKDVKEKEATEKPETVGDIAEKPATSASKMNDPQDYFNVQKQLILSSRKSNTGPIAEGLRIEKKQIFDPMVSRFLDFETFPDETTTNSIKKLNKIKEKAMINKVPPTTATTTVAAPPSTTASPQNLANVGQKEFVLPRPSNPARKAYPEIATRSMNPPSVYDTIKKLLDMEKEADNTQKARGQPQKRYVITDDPLTAELSELKKPSA